VTETLFISDLHLDRERPDIQALFHEFLQNRAAGADALYILGDLFEYWIGDDDPGQEHADTLKALQALTSRGVPVYFLPGNRDFLIGQEFLEQSGCQKLDDHVIIDLYGQKVLLMHGDTLCTDDVEYQQLRSMMRNPQWQAQFLAQPYEDRLQQVLSLRKKSSEAIAAKGEIITDVNDQAVRDTMCQYGVTELIHGHTHRPAVHHFELNGEEYTRYVLGDWYEQGSLLSCTPQGCELTAMSLN
jgi:UDP-2,3-diacylglucosamine hydrolase